MYLALSISESFTIVFFALVIGFVVGGFLIKQFLIDPYLKQADEIVHNASLKIAEIDRINQRYMFKNVRHSFEIIKYYDNKSNYLKVEPEYLMAAELRKDILYYTEIVDAIKANRERHPSYQKEFENIPDETIFKEEKQYKIPNSILRWRENKMFRSKIAQPVVTLTFHVVMHYRSPKGKVNLRKEGSFYLGDVDACLQSVSRSRLDKQTYSRIAAVERGEMSDSLRYDVMNRDGFKCVICGVSASQGARLHVDHIIPIAKGGTTKLANLRTLCERCNIGKSDKIEGFVDRTVGCEKLKDNVCPICGNQLILRKGKYGDFMGCKSFPQCKFTRNISES